MKRQKPSGLNGNIGDSKVHLENGKLIRPLFTSAEYRRLAAQRLLEADKSVSVTHKEAMVDLVRGYLDSANKAEAYEREQEAKSRAQVRKRKHGKGKQD